MQYFLLTLLQNLDTRHCLTFLALLIARTMTDMYKQLSCMCCFLFVAIELNNEQTGGP